MNILFHCGEYPPMPSGGIGSVIKIVAEGLARRGHKVIVAGYYFYESRCNTHIVQNGVHIYNYSLGYRSTRVKCYLYEILNKLHLAGLWTQHELDFYEDKLESLIKEYDIDILEITDFYNFNYCTSSLHFHSFDIPVIMRFHGSAYYLSANSGKTQPKLRLNDIAHFARADYYSYVSAYIRDFTHQMGGIYSPDKEIIIHNMIEDDFLNNKTHLDDSKKILYFGKLVKTKGAYSTIRAFCGFHKTHKDWNLVMAGPAYSDALLDGVPEDVKKHIEFTGPFNREQIKQLIDASSFVCLPSYFETFGMTPLEAMARSKAVIFTERASGPEIIEDGRNGFLVNPDDVSMISAKMSVLADNAILRNEMAANAFHKIESCLCESYILDRLEQYYNGLI